MAWIWPVIAGIASVGSAIATNRANARAAREQMQFQERMSSTAIQRQRADLEAAGFNPALAYSMGGASAPSGAMAAQSDVLGEGISNAMQVRLFKENLEAAKANAEKARAEATVAKGEALPYELEGGAGARAAAKIAEWSRDVVMARQQHRHAERMVVAPLEMTEAQAANATAQNARLEAEAEMYRSGIGKAIPFLETLVPNAATIAGLLKAGKGRVSLPAPIRPVSPSTGRPVGPRTSSARETDAQFRARLQDAGRRGTARPPAVGKLDSLLGRNPNPRKW